MPIATEWEACLEYGRNAGQEETDRAWILTPQDVWVRNPHYHGPAVPHPEEDDYVDEEALIAEQDDIEIAGPRFYVPLDEIPF